MVKLLNANMNKFDTQGDNHGSSQHLAKESGQIQSFWGL